LVASEENQREIRDNYVTTIYEAGNVLLMTYMVPFLNKRKRKNAAGDENKKTKNAFHYHVPKIDPDHNVVGTFDVCVDTFKGFFALGNTRLQLLRNRRLDPKACCIEMKILKCGSSGISQCIKDNLEAVLETEPRETCRGHPRWYYYCGGMSIFKFWLKYLKLFGTEDDAHFLVQGAKNNHYETYHRLSAKKHKPLYLDTDPMRRPSLSYTTARQFWKRYDIKFEAQKCDTGICEVCYRDFKETRNNNMFV
jgi:hypothetical protein